MVRPWGSSRTIVPRGRQPSGPERLACLGRNQVLDARLKLGAQPFNGLERVDLVGALFEAQPDDPGEAQREARLVAPRALQDVERDLDDGRLDQTVATELAKGVGLGPGGHFGDLDVGQAGVGLADRSATSLHSRMGGMVYLPVVKSARLDTTDPRWRTCHRRFVAAARPRRTRRSRRTSRGVAS
jgi:hypothetical protein